MPNNPIRDLSPAYTTPGTARANAALVVGADKRVDVDASTLKIAGVTVTATGAELNILDGVLATAAEINRAADVSTRVVAITDATESLTIAEHDGKVVTLNRTGGIDLTLPAATGSGARFLIIIVGDTTDAYTITVADTCNDILRGTILVAQDAGNEAQAFESGAATIGISLNSGTTGGEIGDCIELIDIATDTWFVRGRVQGSGCEATPFS